MSLKVARPLSILLRAMPALLAGVTVLLPIGSGVLRAQSAAPGKASAPAGWFLAGNRPDNYTTGVDSSMMYTGYPSAFLKAKSDASGFGTLMQTFAPGQYAGKRIRLSANVKSEGVGRSAGLWLRIDGPQSGGTPKMLGFDNMSNRPIRGTSYWNRYEVVLDVPSEAVDIAMGILLDGPGEVWMNSVSVDVVPNSVPTTAMSPSLPAEPQNLSFTK